MKSRPTHTSKEHYKSEHRYFKFDFNFFIDVKTTSRVYDVSGIYNSNLSKTNSSLLSSFCYLNCEHNRDFFSGLIGIWRNAFIWPEINTLEYECNNNLHNVNI